jgi:hypothetical protein
MTSTSTSAWAARKWRNAWIVALILCLLGALYIWIFAPPTLRKLRAEAWVAVEVKGLRATMRKTHGKERLLLGDRLDQYRVDFEYDFVGKHYRSEQEVSKAFGDAAGLEQVIIGRYAPRQRMTAYVNPHAPEQAVLERELRAGDWFNVCGPILIALGALPFRAARRSSRIARIDPLAFTQERNFKHWGITQLGTSISARPGTRDKSGMLVPGSPRTTGPVSLVSLSAHPLRAGEVVQLEVHFDAEAAAEPFAIRLCAGPFTTRGRDADAHAQWELWNGQVESGGTIAIPMRIPSTRELTAVTNDFWLKFSSPECPTLWLAVLT